LTSTDRVATEEREQQARRAMLETLVEPYSRTAFHPVPPEIRPWVSYVFVSRASTRGGPYEFSWLPDASTHIALLTRPSRGHGAPTMADCALKIFGPHLRRHALPLEGWEAVGVALRPGGARVLLGVPLSVVANSIVDAREIWGRWATDALDKVATQRSTPARVALFLKLLRGRADAAPDRFADELLERASFPHGELGLRSLATLAGYSERRLRRKLAEQVGLGPKDLLRINRMQATLASVSGRRGWADHASRFGYCDQSHMIGEFRALLGQPPETFLQTLAEPRLLGAHLAITPGDAARRASVERAASARIAGVAR
jgi:AraC-like DNA-binding protein